MKKTVPASLLGLTASLALVACDQAAPPEAESSPAAEATPVAGDGDGQGDALVEGTPYNATAQISCAGYNGAAPGMCDAGVMRGGETGTTVEVSLADGTKRLVFFDTQGQFLSFGTAEADGTSDMPITSERRGDVTIATLGTETYEIPDVLVTGD